MKKFLVELMKRSSHFITQSLNRYDELTTVVNESMFFFLVFFFWRKLHLTSLFSVHHNIIQLRYLLWNYFLNNLSLLDSLLNCSWYIATSAWSSTSRMLLDFLMTRVFKQQFLYCFTWSTSQFLLLNIYLSTQFFSVLILESSVIY